MKNKKVYGLVGVAALAAVGGTFAYYSAEQTFTNPFKTTNYSTQATEKFNPSGDNNEWKPGAEIDKDVYATNTGDGEVWVRVKFAEDWQREGVSFLTDKQKWNSENFVTFNPSGANEATSIDGENFQDDEKNSDGKWSYNGQTGDDTGSVVYKEIVNANADGSGDWVYNAVDGYFYYKTMLAKGENTTKLLDSVTLCGNADMGAFNNEMHVRVLAEDPGKDVPVYDEADRKNWVTVTLNEGETEKAALARVIEEEAKKLGKESSEVYVYTHKDNILDTNAQGYANADYTLDITVEFVQADEDREAALAMGWDVTNLEYTVKATPVEP